jgi:hypothetical protein
MRAAAVAITLALACLLALLGACGGDDDDDRSSPTDPASTEDTSNSITPTPGNPVVPPLEGPGRGPAPTEFTDFREDPNWLLPEPDDLQPPPEDIADDPAVNPPAQPSCPEDWLAVDRPTEGFKICHPENWVVAGHGYVGAANEERWYSVGIFDFVNESRTGQRAHVSVYVIPQFARPFRFTLDCPQPYTITFAGEPAVVCPNFPGQPPAEAEIISYHVFKNDFDYFVNVATYFNRDGDDYTDEIDEDSKATAIEIAHSFQFIDYVGPGPALGTPQAGDDATPEDAGEASASPQ